MKFAPSLVISIIIALVSYLGLGWIAYDIYLSIYPVTDDTPIFDYLYYNRIIAYNIICGIVNFIGEILFLDDNDWSFWIGIGFPMFGYGLVKLLPVSDGMAALNSLICLTSIVIIYTASFYRDK